MTVYAEVAVDAPTSLKTYTYAIPDGMAPARGQAVWVPFGRASRLAQGIVFGLTETAPVPRLKPIASLIDSQPVLPAAACDLAEWLADYYFASLFECAAVMMPPGFRQRIHITVRLLPAADKAAPGLNQRGAKLLAFLQTRRGFAGIEQLQRVFGPGVERTVDGLAQQALVERVSQLRRSPARPRYEKRVRLAEAGRDADLDAPEWRRRTKQRQIVDLLRAEAGPVAEAHLEHTLGAVLPALRLLQRAGIVAVEAVRVTRDPLARRAFQEAFPPVLSAHQEAAYAEVEKALDGGGGGCFLLHGVTGSGKTELYQRALERCVALGRRGIVLVPEIALEPQTVARFSGRFPGRVAVLHSGLSAGEAYDEWWRIRDGEFDVVIGSRSALFAPQPDLGLIVIDEEHEQSYKQEEPPPRYHVRDVARRIAEVTGAVLVLGSATPALESLARARSGAYRLLELPDRVLPATRPAETRLERGLPAVEVVDLREELKSGNRSIFSGALQQALGATLREGRQAILFLNRRGAATFVQCRDCGAAVRCRRCETPFTYHSASERLVCHLCSAQRRPPRRCPACGSSRIKFLGTGTQRVQKEVEDLFPAARVLRWDRDVAHALRAHEELLDQFSRHEADVLVGTQMIAKGLDLPRVTLVGIVNADVNLYVPDFRAAERTFQLLTQVAGRAGRGEWAGRVIIQTYTPDHYAIAAAARQDYYRFAHYEMAFRVRHGYPPVQPLIRLLCRDADDQRARAQASAQARALRLERARAGAADVQIAGPLPAYFRRVRGLYRWQVLLKGTGARTLLRTCPPPQGWIVDVDPLHIL